MEENFIEVGKARRPPDMTAANAVVVSTQPEKALADGNDSSPCHWRPMSSAQLDAVVFDDDYLFKILGFVTTYAVSFSITCARMLITSQTLQTYTQIVGY